MAWILIGDDMFFKTFWLKKYLASQLKYPTMFLLSLFIPLKYITNISPKILLHINSLLFHSIEVNYCIVT